MSCKGKIVYTLLGFISIVSYISTSQSQPQLIMEIQIGDSSFDIRGDLEYCSNADLLFTALTSDQIAKCARYTNDGDILWIEGISNATDALNLELLYPGYFLLDSNCNYLESSFSIYSEPDNIVRQSNIYLGFSYNTHKYRYSGYINSTVYINNQEASVYVNYFDSLCQIVWSRHFDWDGTETSYDIAANIAGIIYVPINYSNTGMNNKVYLVKTSQTGNIIDTTSYESTNNNSLHFAESINILCDGNLLLNGDFAIEPDLTYAALLLSPDGDVHGYWGDSRQRMQPLPDGGYIASIPDFDTNDQILMQRFNAMGTPIVDWTYTVEFEPAITSVEDPILLVTPDGETILYGKYTYMRPDFTFEDDLYAIKFAAWHTDLEIAIDRTCNLSAIPAPGRFFWRGVMTNNTNTDLTTDVWVIVRGPDGYPSEPLRVWEDIIVPANGVYEADLRQNVPADAASGEYNYIVRAGTYDPDNPQHTIQAYFPLTVTGGTEVDLDPPRTRGVVAAPFDGPQLVEIAPELKTTD